MAKEKTHIHVENMNCSHCSGMVEKTLASIQGISEIVVDLEGKSAAFTAADPGLVQAAVDAVTQAGYPAAKG